MEINGVEVKTGGAAREDGGNQRLGFRQLQQAREANWREACYKFIRANYSIANYNGCIMELSFPDAPSNWRRVVARLLDPYFVPLRKQVVVEVPMNPQYYGLFPQE